MPMPQQYGAIIQQNRGTDEYLNQQQYGANIGLRAGEAFMRAKDQADARAREQARQEQVRAIYQGLGPKSTPKDYEVAMMEAPELKAVLAPTIAKFNEVEQKGLTTDAMQVYVALSNKKPEVALKILEKRKQAHADNPEQAAIFDQMAATIRDNPDKGQVLAGMVSSIISPEFTKMMGDVAGVAKDEAETAGKLTDKKKVEQEILKTQVELEALAKEGGGVVPPEKRPEYELKLRNQYLKETDDFQGMSTAFDKVLSANPTPEGDIALIFNYMKMLDPGSVVREGEFDTAQKTAGITARVWNYFQKVKTGKRLSEDQVKNLKEQAKSTFESGKAKEDRVRARIKKQGQKYKLDVENIFGGDVARSPNARVDVSAPSGSTSSFVDDLFK
jgi:hypothetical protein